MQALLLHFKEYGDVLNDVPCTSEELQKIIYLIERDNYLQMFYDFEFNYLLVLIEFFEAREEYDTCKVIFEAMKSIKRTTGENYNTHF